MVNEEGPHPASLQTKVNPGGSEAIVRAQFGTCGAEIGSAARDQQGKATCSDIDGNDANRRFTAAIENVTYCRTLPHAMRLRLEAVTIVGMLRPRELLTLYRRKSHETQPTKQAFVFFDYI
jgi:hypothetical protein